MSEQINQRQLSEKDSLKMQAFAIKLAQLNVSDEITNLKSIFLREYYNYHTSRNLPVPERSDIGFTRKINNEEYNIYVQTLPDIVKNLLLESEDNELTCVIDRKHVRVLNARSNGLMVNSQFLNPNKSRLVGYYMGDFTMTETNENTVREYLDGLSNDPIGIIDDYLLAKNLLSLGSRICYGGYPHDLV